MSKFICIEHDAIKRTLERPYAIALDRDELYALFEALKKIVDRDADGQTWHYGWIDVPLTSQVVPNTPPLTWYESGLKGGRLE
jgi:hypothetical protein